MKTTIDYKRLNEKDYEKYLSVGIIERSNLSINLKFIESFGLKKSHKILEIGCGVGTLTKILFDRGFDITGVDISINAINYGKKIYGDNLPIYSGDFYKMEFSENSYDIVMSFDVIEHLPDIVLHIKKVKDLLKPGGAYIFQTPNIFINPFWETLQHKNFHWRKYHPNLQSYWSLKRSFRKNGFDINILKFDIGSDFLHSKIKKIIGDTPAKLIIKIIKVMPIWLYPNFYVISRNSK